MKIFITSLLQIVAYAGSIVSSIWAIVEFILYLVKDHPFNWWSVYAILICIGVGIVLFFANLIFIYKAQNKAKKIENIFGNKPMTFQQRIEEKTRQRRTHNLY